MARRRQSRAGEDGPTKTGMRGRTGGEEEEGGHARTRTARALVDVVTMMVEQHQHGLAEVNAIIFPREIRMPAAVQAAAAQRAYTRVSTNEEEEEKIWG